MSDENHHVHYLRHPFQREPDFGVTSVNYDFAELLSRAEEMRHYTAEALPPISIRRNPI